MSICQIYDLCAETLWLGRYGENGARDIAIDVGRWFADLGTEGTVVLVNWRPGEDDTPYNPNVTMDGSRVVWSPSSIDLAISGRGFAELRYYVGNALAKSKTFRTVIDRTPSEGANPPSAAEDWVERMEDAAVTAQTASDTAVAAAETATEGAQAVAQALPTITQAAQTATSAATTATNAATEAALSEEVASTAANAAQAASETATAASQTAVSASGTATTKASQASASASTAATAATTATTKASEATTAATTATTKAGEASTSASTATSAKDTAVSASQMATTKATEATTAAATATSAKTDAVAANTAAQSAKTAAQTAQTGAETAAASVEASAAQIATNAEDISQLKSDLKNTLLLSKSDYIKWQSGTISGGTEQASTTRIRSTYLPIDVLVVSVSEGYKYGFHAYENGIRIGSWNGSAIVSSFAWMTTPTIMSALPTQYQYRIVMAKSGDITIDVSDGANLTATILNDAQINVLKSEVLTGSIFQKSQISGNIVPLSIEARNGYSSKTSSGQISYVASNSYRAYVIPVKESTKYYSSGLLRFVVYLDDNLTPTQDAQAEEVATFTTPVGAKYVAVSAAVDDVGDGLIISEQITLPPKMIINAPYVLSDVGNQTRNQRYTGAYDSAISLSKYPNTLKKGVRVFLSCDVSTIGEGSVTVSFYSNTISGDSLKYTITSTEFIAQRYGGNPSSQQHGLDIANNIQMMIAINAGENLIKVELTSNGQTYTRTFTNNANPSYSVYPKLTATAPISNVSFSWQCSDLLKDIWAIGDSYFSFDSDKRWTYYLNESGLMDNILIAGFPGDTSPGEYTSLESLVKLGTPKYVLWALGMNDGADSNNTPNALWMQTITKVLSLCKLIGATPILATIPTVPTINHEAKNAWVRASGYRYIDFAKAVGADADGHWFGYNTANDMLSSDGVHPSVYGAKALYYRALADFPELAITN